MLHTIPTTLYIEVYYNTKNEITKQIQERY